MTLDTKITDPVPPADDPSLNAGVESDLSSRQTDSASSDRADDDSAFSKVLARKRQERQDCGESKQKMKAEGSSDPAAAGLFQARAPFEQALQPPPIPSARTVAAVPPELQQLVREISVVVNSAGNQQVNIELNSNVLKGLHVRVERQEGGIAIQFQSSSDQVARLLAHNADALSQGLADHGLTLADVRISGPQESARVQDYRPRSMSGGRPGGRQGGAQGGKGR